MKKKMLVLTLALASAIMIVLGNANIALATSRTDTAEVLGATREREDTGEAAVLGADRTKNSVKIIIGPITDERALADIEAKTILADTINTVNESGGVNADKLTADNIEVLVAVDVSVTEGTIVNSENPIYVTFTIPGITEETKIHILHFAGGAVWEETSTEVGTGYVVGKFNSFSPVVIVAEKASLSASANTSSKGTGSATSPRTGDNQIVFVIIFSVIAVVCILATFISLWKEKKNQ